MTYKGRARGRMIELDVALPYPEGQPLNVSVAPAQIEAAPENGPAAIRRAMQQPPTLLPEDVDEFDWTIQAGRLGVREKGVFDAGQGILRSCVVR